PRPAFALFPYTTLFRSFRTGDDADAGYIVQRGAFSVEDGGSAEAIAGPGALIGELALIKAMRRPSTATAVEYSSVIRIARSLFQDRKSTRLNSSHLGIS